MSYINTSVENLNYKPISGYNNFLKGNASFDADLETKFNNILNQEKTALEKKEQVSQSNTFLQSIEKAFGNGLDYVDSTKKSADAAQQALAKGEDVSVHDVMIAAEKSSLSMQMALQVRNKLLNAYTELKNTAL